MTTYLARALQAAQSARRMQQDGDNNGACNRAYYAMFYVIHGLFERAGEDLSAKTHASVLRLFSQRFVLEGAAPPALGRALSVAQNLRAKADYSVAGVSSAETAEAIAAMDALLDYARPLLEQKDTKP